MKKIFTLLVMCLASISFAGIMRQLTTRSSLPLMQILLKVRLSPSNHF